ncbi:hypothetical protein SCP_0805330 [Sparassis crispa]|uniref:Uncharacterized protein n=1 Tax=Sparassis crispa TaxID=139825 RepID=A0A401GUZ9_9APHY|nr:hypothetical protein SCP_0805330 [Sparassis crispa]GBE86009.1 hypothetical protein SCP_0805330 [Sparassis crispa]
MGDRGSTSPLHLLHLCPDRTFSSFISSLSLTSIESPVYARISKSISAHTQSSSSSRANFEQHFELETVSVWEGIIEEFCKAKPSKAEAFIQLFETLRYQEATSDEEISSKHAAFTIYLAELDEIEWALREAGNRGRTPVPDTSAVENADSGAPAPEEALEPSSTPVRSSKCRRDADDGGDKDGKRRVDESLFPFMSSTVSALLSPELLRMLKLKENYTRDLSFSKQSITCHPDCPNVPESI